MQSIIQFFSPDNGYRGVNGNESQSAPKDSLECASLLSVWSFCISIRRQRRRGNHWIDKSWQERLAYYLGSIIRDIEGIAIETGGDSDHSHIPAGLKASYSISDSLRIIKAGSSKWIHESDE
jgi:hypothetical protein